MSTKSIDYDGDFLILKYEPEYGFSTVDDFLKAIDYYEKEGKALILNRTFHIRHSNLLPIDENDDFPIKIIIGRLSSDGVYYQLDKNVFGLKYDVFFDSRVEIKVRYLCYENSSTIAYLSRTICSDVYVDLNEVLDKQNHIPYKVFEECIAKMPTRHELNKYKDKVTSQLFLEYFNNIPDYKSKYENYVTKLRSIPDYKEKMPKAYYELRIEEYKNILIDLKKMLNDNSISEKQWQNKIIDIIKIIYPKYLYVFSSVPIVSLGDKKQLDFLAVDNQGHVDVIEIKKAEIGKLLRIYRNNYSPTKELSGSFTQVEKYIYYLSSSKEVLEAKLNNYLNGKIANIKIKIVNPQGIIIAGRGNDMEEQEKNDFEIVRKAHKDIADVITYDELITRLENTVSAFENKNKQLEDDELPF